MERAIRIQTGAVCNWVYGKNHGEHGATRGEESEKLSLCLIYPRDPVSPVVFLFVHTIEIRSSVRAGRAHRACRDRHVLG